MIQLFFLFFFQGYRKYLNLAVQNLDMYPRDTLAVGVGWLQFCG